jgi:CheY-like chemotaxis protein
MQTVLVVDDSPSVRKVVEHALAARDVAVVSAVSGAEAMERLERDPADLVVSDVVMSDHDGYEVCRFVKSRSPLREVPVMLISGIVDAAVRERAARAGADALLTKPFDVDEFLGQVDRLLARQVAKTSRPEPSGVPQPEPSRLPQPEPSGLKALLDRLAGVQGVRLAAIVDREGFVVEAVGEPALDTDLIAALTSCVAESSEGLGRDLHQGALHGMILEYGESILTLHVLSPAAILVVLITEPPMLGKLRYLVRKALPELRAAV